MACNTFYTVPLGVHKFSFALYNIAKAIYETCPYDPRLNTPDSPVPKLSFIQAITSTGRGLLRHDWTAYKAEHILHRIMTWKAPLIQLAFQFPRPPFGIAIEAFAIVHLLGDPIDTIASLLFTLSVCQHRTRMLSHYSEGKWKALALLMLSYDDCGEDGKAVELERRFKENDDDFDANYQEAAESLAADRATAFFPIMTAEFIFIASYAISFAKTSKSTFNEEVPWHLDILSIGFSLTYAWIVPAVLLASLIGVTQSENAVPRILRQFEQQIKLQNNPHENSITSMPPAGNCIRKPDLENRLRHGAIPSWRPDKWTTTSEHLSEARMQAGQQSGWLCGISIFSVALGTISAFCLSGRTPPDGFGCRMIAEAVILLTYFTSFTLQYIVAKLPISFRLHFRIVMIKDIFSAGIVTAVILTTRIGILNTAKCWSHWWTDSVLFPQVTQHIVRERLDSEYPAVIFLTIAFQLAMCAVVTHVYRRAVQVYLQRDDGCSNMAPLRLRNNQSL